ncbi:hypothetical protein ASE06_07845 [Sphingopyxis sp. Root214]|jgi:hypothetical protein|uniref:DUF3325 domain-containing protein n=1 Tax=unclassified Sphingopyxis TaxID=2614943 RepID=UPI0006FAD4C8|nr:MULTISPECIES: DUF3325 domain-containing protein [unclassified Sphingopyxis]KQZ76387.1 hypothetical protein ASD73_00145 [Sphingopyxis sp. Root154]KRC09725.1 hypothetical protein ASE06_07845 [Sphingopyxis sp. Root214]
MHIEPALLSYAALACLALSTHRLRRDVAFDGLPTVATLRAFAAVLLILAAWRAVHDFGPYQGPVAFIGMVSIAGLPIVLLLSRWPRGALITGIATAAVAFGTLIGLG